MGLAAAVLWLSAGAGAQAQTAAPVDALIDACADVGGDMDRLRCYDLAAAARRSAAAAVKTLPARAEAPPRPSPSLRFDLGYGFSAGDYVGTLALPSHAALAVKSFTGGAGGGPIGEVWLDDWPRRNLSIGLEYIRIANRGSLTANLPAGLSFLTDPVYAHLGVELQADMGLINLAYRPRGLGWLRPVVGVGVGGGYGYAAQNYRLYNDFFGQAVGGSRTASPIPIAQVFAGVDANLTRGLYGSLMGRLMGVSGHPIGVDQSYADFVVSTTLGYRFP